MLVYLATDKPDIAKREATQATNSFTDLPEDEQNTIYSRVQDELITLANEKADAAEDVDSILSLLSETVDGSR
jgi:hypothetical protein